MTATNIIQFPTKSNTTPEVKPNSGSVSDKAKYIRKELKKIGYNSRMVSVRVDSYSMGSSIYVTTKAAHVNEKVVQEIAERVQKVHRCEVTGEILGGGNTYVFCSVEDSVWEERIADDRDDLIKIAIALKEEKEQQHNFKGKTIWRECKHSNGYNWYVGENRLNWSDYATIQSIAVTIGKYLYEQI